MWRLVPTLAMCWACGGTSPAPGTTYPMTRRDDITETIHGVEVADPYRWLEDADAPEVQAWMTAQDDLARGQLERLPERARFAARLHELLYHDEVEAPVHRGGRTFWTRRHRDREKRIIYWKQGDGAEQVLLDPNGWSADGSSALGDWKVSHDGTRVAYSVKDNNSDEAVTHVIDVATGQQLADVLNGTKYGHLRWAPDGSGFYYTWVPQASERIKMADRPGFATLRFHRLSSDQAGDPTLFPATRDAGTFISGEISDDGRWLVVMVDHGWRATDVHIKDLAGAQADWTPLVTGLDARFEVIPWRGRLYVLTNDGAPRYRVFRVDPARPARADWTEIVAEGPGTIEGARILGDRLVLRYLRDASHEVEVHDLDGRRVRTVELPPVVSVDALTGEPDQDTFYVSYSSFLQPSVVLEVSAAGGGAVEWARVKLPIDVSGLRAELVRYPSVDGTEITMFLVHRADLPRDGARPTLLFGYGGFNVAMTPSFVAGYWGWPWLAWLERGGVLAIPHLRGGGEYGEAWHRAGMLLDKQRGFDDFLAAARWLIAQRWTSPQRLAIAGRSNGGLLVGAAMTQAPELFKAVICGVPLLDMLRFHKFASGKTWVSEYGSADDPAQFAALRAYSPYHAVRDGTAYPALLMLSTDHDDRVDPLHARKFVARVQHATRGDAPILLSIERNAGHTGADQIKAEVTRGADAFAFLADQLGL
jgi:prolyl oligopeptidase